MLHGLESKPIYDWLNESYSKKKYLLNPNPPSSGKTNATQQFISENASLKWVVIVPDYGLLDGKNNWIQNMNELKKYTSFSYTVFKGKRQLDEHGKQLCNREKGEEYFPGCDRGNCPFNDDCGYKQQYIGLKDYDIIITVIDELKVVPVRNIVFDESFDLKTLSVKIISEELMNDLKIDLPIPISPPFKDNKNSKIQYVNYLNAEINPNNIPFVDSEEMYFINSFFESAGMQINITKYESTSEFAKHNHTRWEFYQRRVFFKDNMLSKRQHIIFNCATTPLDVVANITETGSNDWEVFKTKRLELKDYTNPVYKCCGNWGKEYSREYVKSIQNLLSLVREVPVFIATKNEFERALRHTDNPYHTYRHYGKGRGDNSAELNSFGSYHKIVILFGRYGLNPIKIYQFTNIGFKEEQVRQMELSEMIQTLERSRLRNHPDSIVLSFSDRNLFPNEKNINTRFLYEINDMLQIDWNRKNKDLIESYSLNKDMLKLMRELGKSLQNIIKGEDLPIPVKLKIIEDFLSGMSILKIANKYNVSRQYVNTVIHKEKVVNIPKKILKRTIENKP